MTAVELEGVEPSDPYFADFKQLNSFANCLLHKLTAQSQCQRALLLLLIGFKVKHFQLHNQIKMRFFFKKKIKRQYSTYYICNMQLIHYCRLLHFRTFVKQQSGTPFKISLVMMHHLFILLRRSPLCSIWFFQIQVRFLAEISNEVQI